MKEYEALAIELALNRGKLLSIQEKLRKNHLTTPLFDTALFTKHLEAACETIFRRYRAGLPPDQIKNAPYQDLLRQVILTPPKRPSLIGMEACVGANHPSRKLMAFGHGAIDPCALLDDLRDAKAKAAAAGLWGGRS